MKNNFINSVSSFYDEVAPYWSHTRKYLWPGILPYLERLRNGDSVLDVGCGNGRLLTGVNKKISYTGVDISKNLLLEAGKLHPKAKFIQADLTKKSAWKNLPKTNAIFSVAVMHHIPTTKLRKEFLDSIASKLNPGGFAYITSWNLWNRKFLKNHVSIDSLYLKFSDYRNVSIPFGKDSTRSCVALSIKDVKKMISGDIYIEKLQYEDKNGKQAKMLDGSNILLVLRKGT